MTVRYRYLAKKINEQQKRNKAKQARKQLPPKPKKVLAPPKKTPPTRNLIPHQQVEISHLESPDQKNEQQVIQMVSKQVGGSPGVCFKQNVQPNTYYRINFEGLGGSNVRIWVSDRHRKTLKLYSNRFKTDKTEKWELIYSNGPRVELHVGVCFLSAKMGDTCQIRRLTINKIPYALIVKKKAEEEKRLKANKLTKENEKLEIVKLTEEEDQSVKQTKVDDLKTEKIVPASLVNIQPIVQKVAIIIYTYDRYTLLTRLLNSIERNKIDGILFEVFIFDDASPRAQVYRAENFPLDLQ